MGSKRGMRRREQAQEKARQERLLERQCGQKRAFDTETQATRAMVAGQKMGYFNLLHHACRCPHCHRWHIGKSVPDTYYREANSKRGLPDR